MEARFSIDCVQVGGERGPGLLGRLLRRVKMLIGVVRVIRDFVPDVVHVQTFAGPVTSMVGIYCLLLRIPSVVKITGERTHEFLMEKGFDRASVVYNTLSAVLTVWDRLILSCFSRLWVTSPQFQERFETVYGISSKRISLVPNFRDLAEFQRMGCTLERRSTAGLPLRILTVARLRPWKGIEKCIRVLSRFEDGEIVWTFAGSGQSSYEQALRRQADEQGVSGSIRWLGDVDEWELSKIYSGSDLFVLMSDREPFGIVLLEAMSFGLPILASNVDGVPFVLEGSKNTTLQSKDDLNALESECRKHLGFKKENTEGARQVNLETLERFSSDRCVKELASIYAGLASSN